MKEKKIIKILLTLLSLVPFFVCMSLPVMLLSGDVRRIGRCLACRLMSAVSKDAGVRLC